jgi:hypothetical protein
MSPEDGADSPEDGAKPKRARPAKVRRSHAERALAGIRAAKREQREVTNPSERVRLLLAEANVLALLELADALAPGFAQTSRLEDGAPPSGD